MSSQLFFFHLELIHVDAVVTDLEIVATHPDYQGKGIGTQLIRWGLEQADTQGVEAYLEASPDAVALYRKLGFTEWASTDTWIENERVKGVRYRNLFMIRAAAKSTL